MKYGLIAILLVALIGMVSAFAALTRFESPQKAEILPMNEDALEDFPRQEAQVIESEHVRPQSA